jgi:hypothetical protein
MDCNKLPPDDDIAALDEALGDNFANQPMPIEVGELSASRRIKLTWSVSRYYYNGTDGLRVRIETSDAVDMPNKIFAYLLTPLQPGATERTGEFNHVCSPSDLEEYPEDEPISGQRPEWFRLAFVDVVLRSRTEVYAFIRDTAADVHQLKRSLDITDRVYPAGELWIGPRPAESSSSSSSSSRSSSSRLSSSSSSSLRPSSSSSSSLRPSSSSSSAQV